MTCPDCNTEFEPRPNIIHICPRNAVPAPAGVNPKDILGLKKPPLRLVPPALLLYVARVMGLGAKKYGPFNWRTEGQPVRRTVYLEAAMRHILSALDGEDIDPESGQPHEAHAAACMGIILDAGSLGQLVDDRPRPGKAAELIAKMTEGESARVETVVPAAVPEAVNKCDDQRCSRFGLPYDLASNRGCSGELTERV